MFNRILYSINKNNTFSLFKQNYSKFATVNLVSNEGVVNRLTDNMNISLNWQLSKVWINPQNNVQHNSLQSSTSGSTSESDIVNKCTKLEFERFMRKMGLIMSKEKTVYVQDGVYNSKNVRIISSQKSDAELASSVLSGSSVEGSTPDIHILYLTGHPEVGKNRKFLFWDDKRKIVLSNSGNINSIKEKLDTL